MIRRTPLNKHTNWSFLINVLEKRPSPASSPIFEVETTTKLGEIQFDDTDDYDYDEGTESSGSGNKELEVTTGLSNEIEENDMAA